MSKFPIKCTLGSLAVLVSAAAFADDSPPLAIHGFGDFQVSNDYLTPRGLLVTNKFATMQVLGGLVFDVYQNPASSLSDISIVAGVWNDINSAQHAADVGGWNEFDWFIGANATIAKDFNVGAQFVQFISPPGNFNDEQNIEFSLKYSDNLSPISINPYAKLFYAVSGDSTVVTGNKGGTFDVELGMVPTWPISSGSSFPVTLSFPTWITVGPANFWGGTDNWGVFTTGVKATVPLSMIPAQLGHWSMHAGLQYYNMLNDKLLQAQYLLGTASLPGDGHRNEIVYAVGFGFGF